MTSDWRELNHNLWHGQPTVALYQCILQYVHRAQQNYASTYKKDSHVYQRSLGVYAEHSHGVDVWQQGYLSRIDAQLTTCLKILPYISSGSILLAYSHDIH